MPVSVILHCARTKNAIFAPTTGRLDTPVTALIAFPVKNYLSIILIYIISMPVSVILHCARTKNAIFAPTTGRLDTP